MNFDTLHRLYVDERLSAQATADRMGIHVSTVERNLRKRGWTRSASERKLPPSASDTLSSEAKLRDLYETQRVSAVEIADDLGVGVSTVHRALSSFGINKRSSAVARVPEGVHDVLRDRATLVALYESRGLGPLANDLGINRQTVANHLARFGVELGNGSSQEVALANLIEQRCRIDRNTRRVIPPMELDIFVPAAKIGIEFNGLYWHTEEMVGADYHRIKWQRCAEAGVSLVQVWEDDWVNRRAAVESTVLYKLGLSADPKVSARSCQVVECGHHEATRFHDEHHIQGGVRASVHVGLEHLGELVAVCSFLAAPDKQWELVRYSTNRIVRGGFTKALAAFTGSREWRSIKTFADLCVSDGGLYETAGFRRDADLGPDYQYIHGGVRVHKFSFRRERFESDPALFYSPDMSESELAEANGLSRIWDAGKIRYVMDKL